MQLTLGQAAKHLGVTKPTISKAISSGKLSAERREDGSFAIDPAELQRYQDANGHRFPATRKEPVAPLRVETPVSNGPETALQAMRERLELENRAKLAEERLADRDLQIASLRGIIRSWEQRQLADQRPRRGIFGWLKAS